MGTPTKDLFHEIISAQSSLNMEPESTGVTTGYLSDRDAWAGHAMEHLKQAALLLHERDVDKLAKRLHERFPRKDERALYDISAVALKFLLSGE